MGPHPKPLRRIITLPKAPVAIPVQKPVNGPETAAAAVPVGEALRRRQPGSTGLGTPPARSRQSAEMRAAWTKRKSELEATLAWLSSTYPASFGVDVRPLAIGAGRLVWPQAKLAGIKRRALNDAMKRHTGSNLYLERLAAPGAVRVDLGGAEVELVSEEHRERASSMLAVKRAQNRSAVGSFDRGPGRSAKWHERERPESS